MRPALYPQLLGPSWHELAAPVRRTHLDGASLSAAGRFRVRHGAGRLGRLLAWLLRVPPATEAASIRLLVTPLGRGERWERSFDGAPLISTQRESGGRLVERIGPLELCFRLEVRGGALLYRQAGAALSAGPLAVSLPRVLAPRVEAREEPEGTERTRVSVAVTVPWIGLLVSYSGYIERDEAGR
ncbi:MAG: DUF4166 domain-containing protein [Thermoleophilaceae bacterium]